MFSKKSINMTPLITLSYAYSFPIFFSKPAKPLIEDFAISDIIDSGIHFFSNKDTILHVTQGTNVNWSQPANNAIL